MIMPDIVKQAKVRNVSIFHLLRSIPGRGKILSLILLYEIHDINRFLHRKIGALSPYFTTSSNSTSNTSVALGGINAPAPRSP
jgi:hypothetical protein